MTSPFYHHVRVFFHIYKGALENCAVGECPLSANEMLIGVFWPGETVFSMQTCTHRHIHTLRHTQVGADEGISAYIEVMELSFLASLPKSG